MAFGVVLEAVLRVDLLRAGRGALLRRHAQPVAQLGEELQENEREAPTGQAPAAGAVAQRRLLPTSGCSPCARGRDPTVWRVRCSAWATSVPRRALRRPGGASPMPEVRPRPAQRVRQAEVLQAARALTSRHQ